MIPSWQAFLIAQGAAIQNDRVEHFGNAATELQRVAHGPIVADLSHLNLIQFAGEDTQTFLQGQLSNDLRLLDASNTQYTSYNTPKGRMLANGLLWQNAPSSYLLQLPASLSIAIHRRGGVLRTRQAGLLGASGRADRAAGRRWPAAPATHRRRCRGSAAHPETHVPRRRQRRES